MGPKDPNTTSPYAPSTNNRLHEGAKAAHALHAKIEQWSHTDRPMQGFGLDLAKCFNTIPRAPLKPPKKKNRGPRSAEQLLGQRPGHSHQALATTRIYGPSPPVNNRDPGRGPGQHPGHARGCRILGRSHRPAGGRNPGIRRQLELRLHISAPKQTSNPDYHEGDTGPATRDRLDQMLPMGDRRKSGETVGHHYHIPKVRTIQAAARSPFKGRQDYTPSWSGSNEPTQNSPCSNTGTSMCR